MPRRNQRRAINVQRPIVEVDPLTAIGIRHLETPTEAGPRTLSLDPSTYSHSRLAGQLADQWVIESAGASLGVSAGKLQAVKEFLAYVDQAAEGSCDLLVNSDTVAHLVVQWARTLPDKYKPTSVMPHRLSNGVQGLIFGALGRIGQPDGELLGKIAIGAALVRKPNVVTTIEFTVAERRQIARAARVCIRAFDRCQRWALNVIADQQPALGTADLVQSLRSASTMEHVAFGEGESPRGWTGLFPDEALRLNANVGFAEMCHRVLHPSPVVLLAYRLLLVEITGMSADEVTSITAAGCQFTDTGVAVTVRKSRAQSVKTKVFDDGTARRSWSAYALLRRLMSATQLLRDSAQPDLADELWLTTRREQKTRLIRTIRCRFQSESGQMSAWIVRMAALDEPIEISKPHDIRRIRKARVAERAIAVEGRMSDIVADEHTVEVFHRHYSTASSIAAYAADRVSALQTTLAAGIDTKFATFASPREQTGLDEIALKTGASPIEARQIRAGAHDVGIADCRDPYDSPFGASGLLCDEAPLNCLRCPNAVVFPSHIPAIAHFADAADARRIDMDPQDWIITFGPQVQAARNVIATMPEIALPTNKEDNVDVPTWIRTPHG